MRGWPVDCVYACLCYGGTDYLGKREGGERREGERRERGEGRPSYYVPYAGEGEEEGRPVCWCASWWW